MPRQPPRRGTGYDRDEVDPRLIENDRGAEEVHPRLGDIEAELAEAKERTLALEADPAVFAVRGEIDLATLESWETRSESCCRTAINAFPWT